MGLGTSSFLLCPKASVVSLCPPPLHSIWELEGSTHLALSPSGWVTGATRFCSLPSCGLGQPPYQGPPLRAPPSLPKAHTAGSLPSYQPSAPRDGPGDPAAQPPPLPPLMAPRPRPPHPRPGKSTTTPAGRLVGPPGSPHHPSLQRPHILCICGAVATRGRPALPRLPPAPASCFQAPEDPGALRGVRGLCGHSSPPRSLPATPPVFRSTLGPACRSCHGWPAMGVTLSWFWSAFPIG